MEECLNEKRAKLYEKVENVANAIGKLEKEGKNKYSGYGYITHTQVTTALRPLLKSHKLSIVMDVEGFEERDFEAKGKITTRSTVRCKFTLTDTETGFQATHQFYGSEQDNTGKSMQQAITQCNKYFMFKLFKITDKETDADVQSISVDTSTPPAKIQSLAEVKKEVAAIREELGIPKEKAKAISVEEAIKKIQSMNTYNDIGDVFRSVPEDARTKKLVDACAARNEAIKLRRWSVPSNSNPKTKYIVARDKGTTYSCQCKLFQSKGGECNHIKEVKEAKHGEGKAE